MTNKSLDLQAFQYARFFFWLKRRRTYLFFYIGLFPEENFSERWYVCNKEVECVVSCRECYNFLRTSIKDGLNQKLVSADWDLVNIYDRAVPVDVGEIDVTCNLDGGHSG